VLHEKFATDGDFEKLLWMAKWMGTGSSPVIVPNPPPVEICPDPPLGCGRTFGLSNFPYYPVDNRCADCIQRVCSPHRTYQSQRKSAHVLTHMLSKASSEQVAVPNINRILGGLVALEGGAEGLTTKWHDALEELRFKSPGSTKLLENYRYIAKLIMEVNKMDMDRYDTDSMNDEELKDYVVKLVMDRMTRGEISALIDESKEFAIPFSTPAVEYAQAAPA
jgi:hypothetical protein